ncbi:MAG: hypothetical protein V1872_05440 [bacterium]
MNQSNTVPLMVSLPKNYRDLLRTIAAENNLRNPDNVISAAYLGRKIICEYLENYLQNISQTIGGN